MLLSIWSKILSSSRDVLLKLSETTYTQKLLPSDRITLHIPSAVWQQTLKLYMIVCQEVRKPCPKIGQLPVLNFARKKKIVNGLFVFISFQLSNDFFLFVACLQQPQTLCYKSELLAGCPNFCNTLQYFGFGPGVTIEL